MLPIASRAAEGATLARALLAWYRAQKRDLPWRRNRDPYAVLVSEAMLQQTRVEAVLVAYERFLRRFPDFEALAAAPEEDVLAAWSGLGYYRRARALQAAARAVIERGVGGFPRTRAELEALPGIGRYTAGALLSIALGQRAALVDGNVERVLSRHYGLDAASGSRELVQRCWQLAEELLPEAADCGDWNQGLMELGATICRPRAPLCAACPWRASCRAAADGRAEALPLKRARPTPVAVELAIACIERGGRWLLEQRPALGRMAGLWQFPTLELPAAAGGGRLFPEASADPRVVFEAAGAATPEIRHTITRHRIRARLVGGRAPARPLSPPYRWCSPAEVEALALTGMARKVWTRIRGETGAGGKRGTIERRSRGGRA